MITVWMIFVIAAAIRFVMLLYNTYAHVHFYKVVYQYYDGLCPTVCHRYTYATSAYAAKWIVYRSIWRYSSSQIIEVIRIK